MLPQNIKDVDSESLLEVGAHNGRQWLVVAGWECQDLSNAGSGKGLRGKHSSTFFPLMDVCASLQLLQPKLSPAFIFENTSIQTHRDSKISVDDFNTICSVIGQPVLLDAARFGSGAHRLRNFWSNLANPTQVLTVANAIDRDPSLAADMFLDKNRISMCVDSPHQQPFYPCNKVGVPRAAFPTLVSFSPSFAIRGIGPGVVYNTIEETYGEPNVREREKILGYLEGSSASEDITRAESHSILGKAMDANCLEYFFTICNSLHENNVTLSKPIRFTAQPHIRSVALTAAHEEYEHTPFDGHYPNRKVGFAHAFAGVG